VTQGKYANVNGLRMYYEVHGSGRPLVLLHGALSAIGTSFDLVLPSLAKIRQVIAVEQQAHGRTVDLDRPLTIEGMAEDTATLPRSQLALAPRHHPRHGRISRRLAGFDDRIISRGAFAGGQVNETAPILN
jgi:pimeloyl-ACP methyl ester carboxylesterase